MQRAVVITGATSGPGRVCAGELAALHDPGTAAHLWAEGERLTEVVLPSGRMATPSQDDAG